MGGTWSNRTSAARPCLYCGGTELKSDEHVLQKTFGTNLVLKDDVCGDCNTGLFSAVDGHLANYVKNLARSDEFSERSMRLLTSTLMDWLDPDSGLWLTLRLSKEGTPILFSQFVILGTDSTAKGSQRASFITQGGSDYEQEIQLLRRELASPTNCSFKTRLHTKSESDQPNVQPAIIRTSRNSYLIRASSTEAAEHWLGVVRGGRFAKEFSSRSKAREERSDNPRVSGTIKIEFGAVQRALAKIALNSLCHLAGPEVARMAGFDALREFAMIETMGIANTFVRLLDKDQEVGYLAKFIKPGEHSLLLVPGTPSIVAIGLYGRPFAIVP